MAKDGSTLGTTNLVRDLPAPATVNSSIAVLRSLNVRPHRLIESELVLISPEANKQHAKSKLYEGDLVVVRSGQPGTTAVVDRRFHGANCIDLIIIRKPSGAASEFLDFCLNSDVATAQFETGTDGAIQQHFNITTAASLQIILPPFPSRPPSPLIWTRRQRSWTHW